MDNIEITHKIEAVLEAFGMSGVKAAEAMGLTYTTFKKRRQRAQGSSFKGENLEDLITFVEHQAATIRQVLATQEG